MIFNTRDNNLPNRFCECGLLKEQYHGNLSAARRTVRAMVFVGLFWLTLAATASAQLVTIGGGALVSKRPTDLVAELHGETPPFAQTRAYLTLSWTDQSINPTIISAVERPVLHFGKAFTGIGAGLLWLEATDYQPYPILVSSTVIPVPIPQTSFVLIGSTLPFEDFDWSLLIKVGVTLVFIR